MLNLYRLVGFTSRSYNRGLVVELVAAYSVNNVKLLPSKTLIRRRRLRFLTLYRIETGFGVSIRLWTRVSQKESARAGSWRVEVTNKNECCNEYICHRNGAKTPLLPYASYALGWWSFRFQQRHLQRDKKLELRFHGDQTPLPW